MAVFSAVSASYALTASYALNAGAGSGTELFIYQTSSLVKAQVGKIHFTGSGVNVTPSGSDGVLVTILGGGGGSGAGDLLSSQTSSMLVGTASLAYTASYALFALASANTDTASFLQINTNSTINASLTISGSLGVSGSVLIGSLVSGSSEDVVV